MQKYFIYTYYSELAYLEQRSTKHEIIFLYLKFKKVSNIEIWFYFGNILVAPAMVKHKNFVFNQRYRTFFRIYR